MSSHYFFFICLLLTLCACGAPEPPATTQAEPAKPPVEQDVTAQTRNDTPETVAEEKLPLPEVAQNPTLPPAPKVRPTKPATDATKTEDKPVIESHPMPQPELEALAPDPEPEPDIAPAPAPPSHTAWNTLLQKHVDNSGNVNYAAFKKDLGQLDAYLATLAKETPTKDWPRNATLAYWINAYNAFTIKRILRDYPIKSIMDLDGGKPWDVKWIELGGSTYSLNQIEHEIIRPRFNEPRIHFAVNCAAASCPPLPNRAFTAENLNSLLQKSTRSFINNPRYNQTKDGIKISKIFDWYGEDFGNLRSYLNKYLTEPLAAAEKIGFKEYDWALNAQ